MKKGIIIFIVCLFAGNAFAEIDYTRYDVDYQKSIAKTVDSLARQGVDGKNAINNLALEALDFAKTNRGSEVQEDGLIERFEEHRKKLVDEENNKLLNMCNGNPACVVEAGGKREYKPVTDYAPFKLLSGEEYASFITMMIKWHNDKVEFGHSDHWISGATPAITQKSWNYGTYQKALIKKERFKGIKTLFGRG